MAPGFPDDGSRSDHGSSSDSSDSPTFRQGQRLAAIRGEVIPSDIDDGLNRAAVIRGIRLDYAFAISEAVTDLCARFSDVAHARNARLIMSNVIPGSDGMSGIMPQDKESAESTTTPYCIWYPDFAIQETYRELVRRFPSMRYQVGRACAAAGWDELYEELDLLPNVCVAEEARESKTPGGRAIYDKIMSSRARYAVMDDYSLTVDLASPRYPAFLNGDTDVLWKLARRCYPCVTENFALCQETRPCIEEDERLSDDAHGDSWLGLDADEVRLLYEPLSDDLPTVKKTLLIQMAAYEGNVDRYVRLARRELMSAREHLCVLRGIYHHTMFARFWAAEIESNAPRIQRLRLESQLTNIKRAVSARRIMMNDTDEFDHGWPPNAPEPFMIWWPHRPRESTLWTLAEKVPQMREQIAIASIICDYPNVYNKVDAQPSSLLWLAAKLTPNSSYLQDLEAKATAQNIELKEPELYTGEADSLVPDLEPTEDGPPFELDDCIECDFGSCFFWVQWEGGVLSAARVERYVWASPALLRSVP